MKKTYLSNPAPGENLQSGNLVMETGCKRGLEYGYWLRFSTEIYGSKREKTVFDEHQQETCFVLAELSESLRELTG